MIGRSRLFPGLLLLSSLAVTGCGEGEPIGPGAGPCTVNCTEPLRGTWSNAAHMPSARREMPAAVLGERIYVAGGMDMSDRLLASVDVYVKSLNAWQSAPDLPEGRHHHGIAALNGKIYVIGGYRTADGPPPWEPTKTVFELDVATGIWRETAPLPEVLAAMAVVVLNGRIYAMGGTAGRESFTATLIFDPATETWTEGAPMPTPREHVLAAVIGETIYVVGGRGGGDARVVEAYTPATNTWSKLPSLTQGRSGHGLAVMDGKLYAFGGESLPFSIYNSVEEYDPARGAWAPVASLPQPKTGMGAAALGGVIHIIGGSGSGNVNWVFKMPD